MKYVTLRLTLAQANAVEFACHNTLAEPANFERGTGMERAEEPLKRAREKIAAALWDAATTTKPKT